MKDMYGSGLVMPVGELQMRLLKQTSSVTHLHSIQSPAWPYEAIQHSHEQPRAGANISYV